MAGKLAAELPFEWVLGDDEFGRSRAFRDGAWALGKSYVLDVSCDTRVRLTEGGELWRVDKLAKSRPIRKWKWPRGATERRGRARWSRWRCRS